MEKAKIAMIVSRNTIISNVILSAFKLFSGIFAHSTAMVSDAVHSLSDVFSTIIVMIGIRVSNKKSDKEHPYGHERMECVAAIVLAVILAATGLLIGWSGIEKIVAGNYDELPIPGGVALIAAILSISIKETMYWYTRSAAKKTESGALMADAWHHRSDALSSIGSFIGIIGARLGFPILDPVVCLVICLFIFKAAYDIFIDAIGKMTDTACDDATTDKIRNIILEQDAVISIDSIKSRLFGDRAYVDVEIGIAANTVLNEAHSTAQKVHDAIETQFPKVKHCMIHVNPVNVDNTDCLDTASIP